MPNISGTFGLSLNGASSSLLKPEISPKNVPKTTVERHEELADESQAGTSKQDEPKPSIGLYEELLASSTGKLFEPCPSLTVLF
jgi:hypothetical protein